jgi:nucleotide-binding universal stress UspA family protein
VLHVLPRLTYDFVPVSLGGPAVPPTGYGPTYDEIRKEAGKYVGDIVSEAQAKGILAKSDVLQDRPSIVEAILDYSKSEGADLIVTGTRGRGGFKKLLMGSVSSGIVSHAECPVLTVR